LSPKVSVGDKKTLIARQITKGGKTLVLRKRSRFPEWAGARRQH
jgi:hypothetical protein